MEERDKVEKGKKENEEREEKMRGLGSGRREKEEEGRRKFREVGEE